MNLLFLLVLPVLYDCENIEFTYDASGVKLRKYIEDSETTTDYAGNFVYIDDQLAYILTSEGRIVPLDTDYNYEYHLTDHLGNTRVVFLVDDNEISVTQVADYYPFGMTSYLYQSSPVNDYLYNGKEFQNENGLDWYDFGARYYDPVLGRWHSLDPQASSFAGMSPYTGMGNNPIVIVDPEGESIVLALVFGIYSAWVMGCEAGFAAEENGGDFWQNGFWKGAIVGFAAGAIGGSGITPLGTEWIGMTSWGAGLGAATQAGTIWAMGGDDYSQIWQGALIGGAMGFMASEQFGNWTGGKGFKSHQAVFADFESGLYTQEGGIWQQDYLNYIYPNVNADYVHSDGQSSFWYNKNNHNEYGIHFTDHAFQSYDQLRGTYGKESFHYFRWDAYGMNGFKLADIETFNAAVYPEERLGVIHQYRNQGLYGPVNTSFSKGVSGLESTIDWYNIDGAYYTQFRYIPFKERWWHFIYKIPRLW